MTFKITDFAAEQQLFRSINYFGIILQISSEHHWIATDEDGDVYAYSYKPWLGDKYWNTCSFGAGVIYLGNATFEADWKESLREIKNV
jgi:hypothetical protein